MGGWGGGIIISSLILEKKVVIVKSEWTIKRDLFLFFGLEVQEVVYRNKNILILAKHHKLIT